ncbi:MAG: NAD(P)H-dependent oxidoreductase [Flavobacteriaceae bacterium]|nr:NAD(P)H-dependent oxidoreductase [Flavobacteriaceae bacterium]
MTSIEKLEWRYATKKFDSNKKLTEEQVEILKNAFNLTATSYGLQPLKMVVVNNKDLQNELKPLAYNQDQVADCSHLLVICIKTNIDGSYVDERFDLEKKIRGIPEESIADFRAFLKKTIESQSKEEIEESSKYQVYIALGNLMTVCAFEGIDSCPLEGFIPSKFDEVLNLKEHNLKSVLLLPVGFRAEDDLMSKLKKVRSPLEESIITIE